MAAVSGLCGEDHNEAGVAEVFIEVLRDAGHIGVVGDAVFAAHDDDHIVVGPDIAGYDEKIAPVVEADEIAGDGVSRLDIADGGQGLVIGVKNDFGAGIAGDIPGFDEPEGEADFAFGTGRYKHEVAPDGGQGLPGLVDEGGGVAFAEDAFGKVAVEIVANTRFVVEAQNDIRNLVFLDDAVDAIDDVEVVAQEVAEPYIRCGGGGEGFGEDFPRLLVGRTAGLLFIEDGEGIEAGFVAA